jgi:hypothetical protein
MSAPMSIFLRTSIDERALCSVIERIFSIRLERIENDGMSSYKHCGIGYTLVLIMEHGLEDDMGIPFSEYQYQIDLDVYSLVDDERCSENFKKSLAEYTFRRLAFATGYPTMLVYNLQRLLLRLN